MIARRAAFALLACTALGACATTDAGTSGPLASASLRSADGAPMGEATVVRTGDTVEVRLAVQGMAPGAKGAHLHAIGKCEAPGFTSAGPHLNPGQRQHGHDNPMGAHLGDLPNVTVGADGRGSVTWRPDGSWEALSAQLFDGDGTAVVVHAGPDDYRTDPSGNSGARIACGELLRR